MKAVPMIFNTEMVQALLDGRKTVTRRPVNEEYCEYIRITGSSDEACENLEFLGLMYDKWKGDNDKICGPEYLVYCTEYPEEGVIPIGQGPARKGDLIYVRETFRLYSNTDECGCSDHCSCPPNETPLYFATHDDGESKWTPSIHMPRSASRLTLKVTDVRIERVKDITHDQVRAEGFNDWTGFAFTWSSIYLKQGLGWDDNPYVWVIEFEVIHKNVDEVLREMEAL